MPEDTVTADLLEFLRRTCASTIGPVDIDERTPLLEAGILDSLRTAMLLNHLRDDLHAPVPAAAITPANFRDVHSIAALCRELAPAGPDHQPPDRTAPTRR